MLLGIVELFVESEVNNITLWIPSGKIVHLPCWWPRSINFSVTEWLEPIKKKSEANHYHSITVWFNSGGEVIHVGEVLTIYFPLTGITEGILGKQTNSGPKISETLAGNKQLSTDEVGTVTCVVYYSFYLFGDRTKWNLLQRPNAISRQLQFAFRVYTMPVIVWSYALKATSDDPITEKNLQQTLEKIRQWCTTTRVKVVGYKLSYCQDIVVQVMPMITATKPTASIPNELPKSTFTEVSLHIDLSPDQIFRLFSPTESYFNQAHASLKVEMDELIKTSVTRDSLVIHEIATRIRVVCPPGSQTYEPPPFLKSISLSNTSVEDSSEHPLSKWSVICHPCLPGHAPQTPYSYGGCFFCPKGYYSGETRYPSIGGCLQCPMGFTTDNMGSTSVRECQIVGGVVSRLIIGFFINMLKEFEQFVVVNSRKELTTRTVEQSDETYWVWKERISVSVWIFLSLYIVITVWLSSIAIYRIHLYTKLRKMYKAQFKLLLKSALVGQRNVVDRTKQQLKTSDYVT
ncbi:unnamed protein product [Schistosoma turkestanicum]|nr:unnamed protein product [Schistosoma turkestanicum]